ACSPGRTRKTVRRSMRSRASAFNLTMPAPVRTVLMTADTIGGVFTYSVELARGLSRLGVRVLLATMGRRLSAAQLRALVAIETVEVFESSFKLEWMSNPWSDVQAAGEWLLTLAEEYNPDLIHLNGYAHAALPWRAPV